MSDGALSATILLHLYIENNNRFLRGKKCAIESIVRHVLPVYGEIRHQGRNELSDEDPVPRRRRA